ncbi:flagellar biosynthesis anti-sigma factor FlgM [Anaerosacchariphilus polymeriproducens]|uniref:Negative regulator of flagellin synthesis n=1 Tax=Anaerosacchariphilus polymeriproducens TaxID=1812858 RepID=A0A371AQQ0_9FIRM|nr:flagellar biosynthesis anti-sigma factor FlgM [Anaerosacchariphilus polymeriproducens]RDU21906.1 flagellar biosynthesis anti-sigma factor FlgM [Anaerosacchariphilus polymeriproducens]
MRIDAYNKISQLYNTNKVNKCQKTADVQASDKVQISQAGLDFQLAKKAVAEAPDVREDVVSSLKSSVKAGTYQVDNEDFASKLMQKYKDMI